MKTFEARIVRKSNNERRIETIVLTKSCLSSALATIYDSLKDKDYLDSIVFK